MPKLKNQLNLDRCPHCGVHKPHLNLLSKHNTGAYDGTNLRNWCVYNCTTCGGVVTAAGNREEAEATEIYPQPVEIDESLPERAKHYLKEAVNTLHSPSAAMVSAASAVDAMLKEKGYLKSKGSLNARIKMAATDHVITPAMELWAHEVRIGANEQRHADEEAPLPGPEDGRRAVDFAKALGDFLFVIPSRVRQGIIEVNPAAKVPEVHAPTENTKNKGSKE